MSKAFTTGNLVRYTVGMATGVASYSVAKAAIKNNLAEPETKIQKITIFLGTIAIAGVASANAERYAVGIYDDIVKTIKTTAAEGQKTAQSK